MHPAARAWVARWATIEPLSLLEIGCRDINGGIRDLFPGAAYTGLDIADGPGVDVVADAATWTPDAAYDLVVCCEVFEHTEVWPQILATAYAALRPGGRLIATMAGPGRAPHSAFDGGQLQPGEWYANVGPEAFGLALVGAGFGDLDVDYVSGDTRATAFRPEV